MTIRSVILGLLAAVVICGVTFFNDMVMKGTSLIGNFVPIAVFGGLLIFVLLVNPLLGLIHKRFRLKGREVAVAAAIALFACYIPGRGLMHYFTTFLMLPHQYARNAPEWQGGPARVERGDVRDWPAFAERLRELMAPGSTPLADAAARLAPKQRERLNDALKPGAITAAAQDEEGARAAIIESLKELLKDKALAQSQFPPGATIPQHVKIMRGRDPKSLLAKDVEKLNRGVLELWMGDSLRRRMPGTLEDAPPRMLADVSSDPDQVPKDFMSGLAEGKEQISFRDIPWHVWKRTLLFWIPLILSIAVAVIALAVIVHRQWSSHEHLPYPTIEFARSLLPNEDGGWNQVFRNRLFWLGALVVMSIYLNNYMCKWWPNTLIEIKTTFDFSPLLKIFETFKLGGGEAVARPILLFVPLGFAYFLASEVSLSLGIGTYVFFVVCGILAGYGVTVSPGMWDPSDRASLHAGAYFGLFLCLLYTGRHYYLTAFRRTLFLPARDKIEPHVAWAGRVFLVCSILFIVQLTMVGVEWQMAILYLIGLLVIYVVISRLLAEAGVFFISAYFLPCAVLWGAFGAEAGGPSQLFILVMVSSVLVIDAREALMPFVISSLKLADGVQVPLGRLARWGCVALVLGFAVAVPVTLYWQYQEGAMKTGDGYTLFAVPYAAFIGHQSVQTKLAGQDRLQAAEAISGWERFPAASPQRRAAIAFAITFCGVLIFAFLRNRFAWWPLHPIIFVVLGTYQSNTLGFSILLGWLLKVLVVKYGGSKLYIRLKPLVIGVIAGEILGAVIPVIVGGIYYAVTGEPPKSFTVLPR